MLRTLHCSLSVSSIAGLEITKTCLYLCFYSPAKPCCCSFPGSIQLCPSPQCLCADPVVCSPLSVLSVLQHSQSCGPLKKRDLWLIKTRATSHTGWLWAHTHSSAARKGNCSSRPREWRSSNRTYLYKTWGDTVCALILWIAVNYSSRVFL